MGINRHLPGSSESIYMALDKAKGTKDNPPSYGNILSTATSTRLDAIFITYGLGRKTLFNCQGKSTEATTAKDEIELVLRFLNSHYIQVLNFMIRDGVFPAEYRAFFNIPVTSATVPDQASEKAVEMLSQYIIDGEPLMITAGGKAVPYPLSKDISDGLALLKAKQQAQANALVDTKTAMSDLKTLGVEASAVTKKVWDEVETHFNEEPIESMRNDSRIWGLVYVSTGTPLVISAHIVQIAGGIAVDVSGVEAMIVETDETTLSAIGGLLSLNTHATGKVTLRLTKTGLVEKDIAVDMSAGTNLDLGIIVMAAI